MQQVWVANRLGDIALARSDRDSARGRFEAAQPFYRQIGDVPGEANRILSLGDIARAQGDSAAARRAYETATALCERIPEPYSIGSAHLRLAQLADGAERADHIAVARAARQKRPRPMAAGRETDPLDWEGWGFALFKRAHG